MIDYKDKRINEIDKKRIYLIDKINAHFKQLTEYKNNPIKSKRWLIDEFDKKIAKGLEIFK